jgi:putative selenium metabolism hydrolase
MEGDAEDMSNTAATSRGPSEIDDEALTDLALRLVGAASPSGHERDVAAIVRAALERLGFDVEVDVLGNVVGTLYAGPGPCILLDSHMDTVGVTDPAAWSFDPAGELADGRLYGRGAMDMKGPLAASIHGVAALRHRLTGGRLVVCGSIAEELVEGPATVAVAEQVRPDAVIICEATSCRVAVGQRGRAEITVDVAGIPTHSSRPDLGVNAAEAMADVVRELRGIDLAPPHPGLRPAVLVLTDILSRPYPGLSVVPDRCVATYDRRTLPGESEADVLAPIRAALERALRGHSGAVGYASIAIDLIESYTGQRVEAPNFAPAWWAGDDAPIVRAALAGLRAAGLPAETTVWDFCTNGSGTAGRLGLPTVGYGPGEEELAHRIDEHIELAALHVGARGYAAIVQSLSGAGAAG